MHQFTPLRGARATQLKPQQPQPKNEDLKAKSIKNLKILVGPNQGWQ